MCNMLIKDRKRESLDYTLPTSVWSWLATTLLLVSVQCQDSLGAAYGGLLKDEAFSATSSAQSYDPFKGRLNAPGGWIPKNHDPTDYLRIDYLQIDLGEVKTITGIVTQGVGEFFSKSYLLRFSINGTYYEDFIAVKQIRVSFHLF